MSAEANRVHDLCRWARSMSEEDRANFLADLDLVLNRVAAMERQLTTAQVAYVELEKAYMDRGLIRNMGYYWQQTAQALYPSPAASARADALHELISAAGDALRWFPSAIDGDAGRAMAMAHLAIAYRTYTTREDTPL